MNYLEKLEYSKILQKLSNYCITSKAKEKAENLVPSQNKKEVESMLQETTEAANIIYRCSTPPGISFKDKETKIVISNLESYGVLSLKAILDLTQVLKNAEEWKNYFYQEFIDQSEYPILDSKFKKLYTNSSIVQTISKSVIDENTLEDNASKNLATIRRKQRNAEQDIKQKLNSIIHSPGYSKYIQENIVTIRNDRYVIPVKEEYRGQIKGLIHDISSTGSTIFIEPLSVFELNNEINNLKIEENIEIEKILQELTKLFYPYIKELNENIEVLTDLDFIFAKAKYARSIKAEMPQINDKKQILLEEARHPLIPMEDAVPVSLTLGKDYQTLVITGPNAGGKTVTLKTVGLLICMACSGLHIPANKNSSICVFNKIFADIGDDQSIANSLSTFSAHMKNIVDIVDKADSNSLVLLDELGSGTDPIEGQALAVSILEYLKQKGALVISTTHYEELKKYALVTDGFENASVEFNVETLTPTYHLLLGVPGKSNAFAISKKLGLKEEIINNSKNRIEKDDIDFETLIKDIYDSKAEIEEKKNQISKDLQDIEILKKELKTKNMKRIEEEENIIQNAKIQARNILLDAKEEANKIIKNMQEIQKHEIEENTKYDKINQDNKECNPNRRLNELRNELNNKIKQNVDSTKTQLEGKEQVTGENQLEEMKHKIKPHTIVWSEDLQKEGIVISNVSKDNQAIVQFGNIKMSLNIKNLEVVEKSENNKQKQVKVNISTNSISKAKNAKTEINVIGLNVEEANFIIDKFLDDSSLANLKQVRIVHGKGTGKLRNGIHQFLKKNPHVKSYRMGTFGEGEMGVTVVELK